MHQTWFLSLLLQRRAVQQVACLHMYAVLSPLNSEWGFVTLKPLWYSAFEMLKDALKGKKKSLISSLMMEVHHRLAFTLQHQRAPSFLWLNVLLKLIYECQFKEMPLNYYFTINFRSTTWESSALYGRIQEIQHIFWFTDDSDLPAPYAANL